MSPSEEDRRRDRRPVPRHLPGNIARRYRVLSLLGSGGVGEVVEAYDLKADRQVALKILKREAAREPRTLERFFREATALGRLSHPSIAKVYETGQDESGLYYLAMEMVVGRSLKERLRQEGRMAAADAIRLGAEVCEVMHVAHQMDIIHRDLKPSNLLLPQGWESGQQVVKVVDFGIAKIFLDKDTPRKLTSRGDLVGTPRYMSPEQARGHDVDGRADLYALGCILYEALSGHVPFGGPDHFAMLLGHMERTPVRLDELVGQDDVPTPLADFVHRLLSKQPDQRPVNAAAADANLRQLLNDAPKERSHREIPTPEAFRANRPIPGLDATPSFSMGGLELPSSPSHGGPRFSSSSLRALSGDGPSSGGQTPWPTEPLSEDGVSLSPPSEEVDSLDGEAYAPDWDSLVPEEDPSLRPTEEASYAHLEDPPSSTGRALGIVAALATVLVLLALTVGAIWYFTFYQKGKTSPQVIHFSSDSKEEAAGAGEGKVAKEGKAASASKRGEQGKEPAADKSAAPPKVTTRKVEIQTEPPGAMIFRDGEELGKAPLALRLPAEEKLPAVYLLKAPGHQAQYLVVRASDFVDGQVKLESKLPPLTAAPAKVELHTEPQGVEVYDGDDYIGLTPLFLSLPTRRQFARLRLVEGKKERSVWVALPAGQHILHVSMKSGVDPVPEFR